ncbi:MAG: histidine phosphatase family protein [Fibrobacter sp.]|nr:histidine phosphatase family protein [Fibrobacter sp.]
MNQFESAANLFKIIRANEKLYLLIRHAERYHITKEDADSGAHVGLTDKGKIQAFELGKLFPKGRSVQYFSSPVGRCIETARGIERGRVDVGGLGQNDVAVLDCLGDFFVKDFNEYQKALDRNFYANICEWVKGSENPAFYPLHERSVQMREMLYEKGKADFNVFVSHDAWIVPCLSHFCGHVYTESSWMNFLTGIAFLVDEKGTGRVLPVTGLADGNLLF